MRIRHTDLAEAVQALINHSLSLNQSAGYVQAILRTQLPGWGVCLTQQDGRVMVTIAPEAVTVLLPDGIRYTPEWVPR